MQIIGDIRDRDWPKAGLAMLSMLLAAVLAFAVAQTRELNAANARIDAMVQKAFYETCELTEGMAVNFRKLLVAGERGQMQALLNETALQTQGAMSDLALLPLGQETVTATLKFINQAGDFARTLSVKLGNGGELTPTDYETLQTLSETAASFSVSLARLLDRYERGEAVFDGAAEDAGQENLAPITNPAGEYPVLLYDGPFSDGRSDGDFKALQGLSNVDEATARQRLTAFLGQQVQDVRLTGEGSVPVDCYEYSLRMGDYQLSAGVTKAGGEVLYLLCDSDVGDVNITQDAAVDAARAFLLARGYGTMEMSYMSLFDGILTVNFAAVQDGIVLYPDLVKVQVSMRDGAVIGLEPAGYLMNHVARVICSTSEVCGAKIGTESDPSVATVIVDAILSVLRPRGIFLAAQCCEHLNRAIVIEKAALPFAEAVNVLPQPKAGGSFATAAYAAFSSPVVVEEIGADAGLDIGGTLIGMHLKKVAVPVRLSEKTIGHALLLAARTRPKFIGGIRAVYDDTLL